MNTLHTLRAVLRNPIEHWRPEHFEQAMVVERHAGPPLSTAPWRCASA